MFSRIARGYKQSWARDLFRPLERLLLPLLLRRGKILFGPLRGLRFPDGGRGTLLGTYEAEVQEVLSRFIKPSDVFYDLGAHHGYLALLGSKLVADSGQVFCFEPLPRNMERLRRIVDLNKLQNVTCVPMAASDHCGTAKLYVGNHKNDYRPSLFPWKGEEHLAVETTTLDTFIGSHRAPNFIKLDVEGAEFQVLQGAVGLLAGSNPPVIVIEAHSEDVHHAVSDLLSAHHYVVRSLAIDPQRPYPHHVLAIPDGKTSHSG